MKMRVIAGMAICSFVLSACSLIQKEQINPNMADGSANFPFLKTGHELHYAYSGQEGVDSMSIKFVASPSPGTYKAEVSYKPSGNKVTTYYHASGMDLYTSSNGNFMEYEHWLFSREATLGEFWSREVPGLLYTYTLVGENVTVRTPRLRNTFTNCLKITGKKFQGAGIDTIYFKPDMGIVFFDGVESKYELARKNFGAANLN